MTAALRLFRIETRRSLGLWLLAPMLILAAYLAWVHTGPDLLSDRIFRPETYLAVRIWPEVNLSIRNTVFLLGPLAAGLAAMVAGRNRRPQVQELLITTPRPPATRDLALFAGTTIWPCAAYVVTALGVGLLTAQRSSWGGPDLLLLLVGLSGVLATGAIGYAAGSTFPSRFTAPVVAVGVFVGQALPEGVDTIRYLSPVQWGRAEVFYGVQQDLSLRQSLWLLSLTAAALAAVVYHGRRTVFTRAALIAAVAVTLATAAPLLLTDRATVLATRPAIQYEPVCDESGTLPVCVHPAYGPLLPEVAVLVRRLAEPLVGIRGGPVRAEQRSIRDRGLQTDGTLAFNLYDTRLLGMGREAESVVESLVVDRGAMVARHGDNWDYTDMQRVLIAWLLTESGAPVSPPEDAELAAATERFTALDNEVRRGWLAEHYTAIRVGELSLRDLP